MISIGTVFRSRIKTTADVQSAEAIRTAGSNAEIRRTAAVGNFCCLIG